MVDVRKLEGLARRLGTSQSEAVRQAVDALLLEAEVQEAAKRIRARGHASQHQETRGVKAGDADRAWPVCGTGWLDPGVRCDPAGSFKGLDITPQLLLDSVAHESHIMLDASSRLFVLL